MNITIVGIANIDQLKKVRQENLKILKGGVGGEAIPRSCVGMSIAGVPCKNGDVFSVSDEAGASLIARGLAVEGGKIKSKKAVV